jgi:hypothetical protein
MDRPNRHRALADGPGHTLDGAVPRVAHREYARHAGLERQRLTLQPPSLRGNVTPRQDVLAVVALDDVAKPFRARFGTDQDEDRRGSNLLALARPYILQSQGLEAVPSAAIDDSSSQAHTDIVRGLQLLNQVVVR